MTGASRGIGRAIARRLAAEGADVVLSASRAGSHGDLQGTLDDAVAEIRAAGARAEAVTANLASDEERADLVARTLGLSPATLFRRLRAENCQFKDLVTQRSKDIAVRLLRDSSITVGEISARLGYTDPATFCRAFRRWFDASPREFRRRVRLQRGHGCPSRP